MQSAGSDSLVLVDVGEEDAGGELESVLFFRQVTRGVADIVGLHFTFEFRHLPFRVRPRKGERGGCRLW